MPVLNSTRYACTASENRRETSEQAVFIGLHQPSSFSILLSVLRSPGSFQAAPHDLLVVLRISPHPSPPNMPPCRSVPYCDG
mmetsp:Transcript_10469/g.32232  ORF Transcript_10469/g.32232 Transcript_10469/m.32232 type:complete len:82 (+) Transcript_10469:473-718(+)